MSRPWTKAERETLRAMLAEAKQVPVIAMTLNRTPQAVSLAIIRLKRSGFITDANSAARRGDVWTDAQDAKLKRLAAAGKTGPEIGKAMGRSARAVYERARRLRNRGVEIEVNTGQQQAKKESEAPIKVTTHVPFFSEAMARARKRAEGMVAAGMTPSGAVNQVYLETGQRVSL